MIVLLVAAGAAIGAPARYLTDRAFSARFPGGFPWGTFVVNVAASFVLGVTIGLADQLSDELRALIATGFCATLSTYSTFSYELLTVGRSGRGGLATGYALASVAAGLAAGALGWAIA